MSMPRILKDLFEVRDESITATVVSTSNGKISLSTPLKVSNGSLVKFIAPCDCSDATHITIDSVSYQLVDTVGSKPVGLWVSGAMISVVLDSANKKAFIQSPTKILTVNPDGVLSI